MFSPSDQFFWTLIIIAVYSLLYIVRSQLWSLSMPHNPLLALITFHPFFPFQLITLLLPPLPLLIHIPNSDWSFSPFPPHSLLWFFKMVLISQQQLDQMASQSLWRPQLEKDACGVGFCASVRGIPTHKVRTPKPNQTDHSQIWEFGLGKITNLIILVQQNLIKLAFSNSKWVWFIWVSIFGWSVKINWLVDLYLSHFQILQEGRVMLERMCKC